MPAQPSASSSSVHAAIVPSAWVMRLPEHVPTASTVPAGCDTAVGSAACRIPRSTRNAPPRSFNKVRQVPLEEADEADLYIVLLGDDDGVHGIDYERCALRGASIRPQQHVALDDLVEYAAALNRSTSKGQAISRLSDLGIVESAEALRSLGEPASIAIFIRDEPAGRKT